jgi:valyl-tRNA synthetase
MGVYHFSRESAAPVYSIDTPPPTVSGHLHLGHVYSYSQTDFVARFWRMNGFNVYYPMGYDDNGLPTERLVERRLGITAAGVGRQAFIEKCLEVSVAAERDYEALWKRLGLSIDWRYTYRTIDERSRWTSQWSFIDLYRKGLAYRKQAPAIWCPECRTAIAQAELNDLDRQSEFFTLAFRLGNGETLPIATTRPELLPACVAVFVHPDDARFKRLVGQTARVPLFDQEVPILEDASTDPEKGTGAVMCCTFGDVTDVAWWRAHNLPLVESIGRDGRLTEAAGEFAGLAVAEARGRIVVALAARGLLLDRRPIDQSVRVHERCDTPVEYVVAQQWFVRALDFKADLLDIGERLVWHPPPMQARYREWVENLAWDWCVSRQRCYGVKFPAWYCDACGEIVLADETELPVDPTERPPSKACACGNTSFTPEQDVMDTWATSSLTPQIVGAWPGDQMLYASVFPFSLRSQAHEIIRTWAFYTLLKSRHHFDALPWREVAISGWGLAPEGAGKISKSRGGGPVAPMAMVEKYSADSVRYWAASAGFGRDAVISEEKIQAGARLVTKLWNVARFAERFIAHDAPPVQPPALSPADRWILSKAQRLIRRATQLFRVYDYAAAKNETEDFFWRDLADNYLEMCKQRLYDASGTAHVGARFALRHALLVALKLFAPFLPHVTEEIYQGLFRSAEGAASIHTSRWPTADERLIDELAESGGEMLVAVATAVRRYKSERGLSLGTELARLCLATGEAALAALLREAEADLLSITRARQVSVGHELDPDLEIIQTGDAIDIGLAQ